MVDNNVTVPFKIICFVVVVVVVAFVVVVVVLIFVWLLVVVVVPGGELSVWKKFTFSSPTFYLF